MHSRFTHHRRSFLSLAAAPLLKPASPALDLPDFSNCGYGGGGVAIPDVPVRLSLRPESGDATARIQAAIDRLAALPYEQRGAILLARGQYEIGGALRIAASGIVLRGEGGATLVAAGDRPRALIEIRGAAPGRRSGEAVSIVDEMVPVGARTFRVASSSQFRIGQLVTVRRVGNTGWIREIGMDRITPRPGAESTTRQWAPFHLDFERIVTAVENGRITVDAPIFCAIERRWGGGDVAPFDDSARISRCGVEDLHGVSAFDPAVTALYGRAKEKYFSGEAHASDFVSIDNANDCWVRRVSARCFSYACVNLRRTRQVTVSRCDCREMVSQITGGRRYPYSVSGQLTLVQDCTADTGRHDFVVGSRVPGPNVFLDCKAGRSFATSEPHHRWSVGGLYDNVKADIAIQDRQYMGTGHGWAGANYVVWNCEGSLTLQSPPTAANWAVGHVGPKLPGAFAPRPDGVWISPGRHVTPRSLYQSQLAARLKGDSTPLAP